MKFTTVGSAIKYYLVIYEQKRTFLGHGSLEAWDEVVYLVLWGLGLPQRLTRKICERKLTALESRKLLLILKKRTEAKIPAAYLTHEAYFAGFKFYVDNRVLIPRSPLGEAILARFQPWLTVSQLRKVRHILDLGTGSGCIAISCAKLFPRAQVDAVDLSIKALHVAAKNVTLHKLQGRVKLFHSDLFTKLSSNKTYDVIIANPPYVGKTEYSNLPTEYYHEPKMALVSGRYGDEIIERILEQAADYLKPQGILIVEVGNSAARILKRYPRWPFMWLEFSAGEGEVFLLTRKELLAARAGA